MVYKLKGPVSKPMCNPLLQAGEGSKPMKQKSGSAATIRRKEAETAIASHLAGLVHPLISKVCKAVTKRMLRPTEVNAQLNLHMIQDWALYSAASMRTSYILKIDFTSPARSYRRMCPVKGNSRWT